MPPATVHRADVALVGAGAAGLSPALAAPRAGARAALVPAPQLAHTASYWAQGGIAAALADDDDPALHQEDTERAGRELTRPSAARALTTEAPERVRDLEELGVRFDADRHGRLALGLEGGHSRRRVVHAGGSATGRRVVRQLSALAAEHPHVDVIEGARASGLWTHDGRCIGVVVEDGRAVTARGVVLCTGGAAARRRRAGLAPPRGPTPGAPAAHYGMGGIVTDLHARSTVPGLLAVGETACTGLHGANRLASNSLSECFVFGERAARAAFDEP